MNARASFAVNRTLWMELIENGEWRLADRPERLAHTSTLAAVAR